MVSDGRLAVLVSGTAAVTLGSALFAIVAFSDGPAGPFAGVLFLVFLLSVLALFASVIVSADRFVRTLPPHPGRKHGVVRRWCFRQVGRVARLIRASVLGVWHLVRWCVWSVWHLGGWGVRSVRNGLRAENRRAAQGALARFGHAAVEIGFGGPPDEVECERHVRPRFDGRHARPAVAGEERRRPRRFRSPSLAPHDAFALVMRTPPAGQHDRG